jgi:hypothetical protein
MKPRAGIRLFGGVCLACVLALAGSARNSVGHTNKEQMRAYINPVTGQLLSEPPAGELQPLSLPQPDDSKIEILNLPGGVKGVRFHGQRRATVIATVDADGNVKTDCIEGTATALEGVSRDDRHETH